MISGCLIFVGLLAQLSCAGSKRIVFIAFGRPLQTSVFQQPELVFAFRA